MIDVYPQWNWNFVFGEADPDNGVAVCSFARFDPTFHQRWEAAFSLPPAASACVEEEEPDVPDGHNASKTQSSWAPFDALFWKRAIKTLCHEIGHLFHMEHCVYYQCAMNGAKNLAEQDQSPLHLCPICLRKLHYAIEIKGKQHSSFSPLKRYQSIADFFAGSMISATTPIMTCWSAESVWVDGAIQLCRPTQICFATRNRHVTETASDNHGVRHTDGSSSHRPKEHFCACCLVDQEGIVLSKEEWDGDNGDADHVTGRHAKSNNRYGVLLVLLEEEEEEEEDYDIDN
eukprot:CAMPEP_0194067584 /NCGR_PEP_ID=MMETSP0009_2-20130614/86636_1 /TAXON_ID=210454 /ORGANISM="Grammatophora oceanica, Strain CCMP 410" /LENGTH=287 /DNA_ID=CAMNT_0038720617 /DNA_START=515 /DNA_END=1378 /DNA_ORIENTATION=-